METSDIFEAQKVKLQNFVMSGRYSNGQCATSFSFLVKFVVYVCYAGYAVMCVSYLCPKRFAVFSTFIFVILCLFLLMLFSFSLCLSV